MAHGPWAQGKLVMAKWRMANEQVAHGEMTHALMAHGKLRMGNGEWDVTWDMTNGNRKWQKADGKWVGDSHLGLAHEPREMSVGR